MGVGHLPAWHHDDRQPHMSLTFPRNVSAAFPQDIVLEVD